MAELVEIQVASAPLPNGPDVAVGSGFRLGTAHRMTRGWLRRNVWRRHPDRGIVAPSEFIPLAEETGLIVPLGRWIMREACRQASAWQRQRPGSSRVAVAVNVSGAPGSPSAIVLPRNELSAAPRPASSQGVIARPVCG